MSCGEEVKKAIWKATFAEIIDLFETVGWTIKTNGYYTSLDRCRLVVNAYKHGNGESLSSIKASHPEFLSHIHPFFMSYVDHKDLKVDEVHITEFSDAIINFWKDVPEYIWINETSSVPAWLQKACDKRS